MMGCTGIRGGAASAPSPNLPATSEDWSIGRNSPMLQDTMLAKFLEFRIGMIRIICFENQHTPSRTFVRGTLIE